MEPWNLRTYFWGRSFFKHSCLGENSNCPLSVIHFTMYVCLHNHHVRKRNRELCQTSKERCSWTPGPHQHTLVYKSILIWGRWDPWSLMGTPCWSIPKVHPSKILSPCSDVYRLLPCKIWSPSWIPDSSVEPESPSVPCCSHSFSGLGGCLSRKRTPHLFLMPAVLCWIVCCWVLLQTSMCSPDAPYGL